MDVSTVETNFMLGGIVMAVWIIFSGTSFPVRKVLCF